MYDQVCPDVGGNMVKLNSPGDDSSSDPFHPQRLGWSPTTFPKGSLNLLGQWLNFKLFGITYLVGKIKFKLFFQGPLAE